MHRILAVVILATVSLVVVALALSAAHDREHTRLAGDFSRRAALAAHLTSGGLQSSRAQNIAYAQQTYGGNRRAVQRALDAASEQQAAVLGADDEVLAVRGDLATTQLSRHAAVRVAHRGIMGFSSVRGPKNAPTLLSAVKFPAKDGPRIWLFEVPASAISDYVRAYLTSALAVGHGRAYLVDTAGQIVASSGRDRIGSVIRDRRVQQTAALREVDGSYVAAARVDGTPWRIVFVAPVDSVLGPTAAGNRQGWMLFAGLVLVVLVLIGLAANAVRQASRLAHEREHDSLTGLPTRALFARHTADVLDRLRRQGGSAAALFVDLDAFKPVNDTYGHAAGDELLMLVAARLVEDVRSADIVSRFGGDEFVVLCQEVDGVEQAREVAVRIQRSLSRPFQIGSVEAVIGCSIGIALIEVPLDGVDVPMLIQRADAAMYEAKRHQRGTIAVYSDTQASVGDCSAAR